MTAVAVVAREEEEVSAWVSLAREVAEASEEVETETETETEPQPQPQPQPKRRKERSAKPLTKLSETPSGVSSGAAVACGETGSDSSGHGCASEADVDQAAPPQCCSCKAPLTMLHLCGGCEVAVYCGSECQLAHWATHWSECAAMSGQKE